MRVFLILSSVGAAAAAGLLASAALACRPVPEQLNPPPPLADLQSSG